MTQSKLHKYVVKLAVCNISEAHDPNIVADLKEDIALRPHLTMVNVSQDVEQHRVVVELALDSRNQEMAARQMREELYEMMNGLLNYIEGVHIELLDTHAIS